MLTRTIDNIVNRGLPRSPRARELVAQLKGRSVAIEIDGFARVRVESDGTLLHVAAVAAGASGAAVAGATAGGAAAADATLCGGPLALLALMRPGAQGVVQRGAVTISGDGQLAEHFQELSRLLQPDFEEELSLLIGDVPAHQLARWVGIGGRWLRHAARTTFLNAAEYLAHERADLVSGKEGEQFLHGVDAVREAVDRLEARLARLERRQAR
jgi:ubiquinone biosynthesis accessory factor UbiJ